MLFYRGTVFMWSKIDAPDYDLQHLLFFFFFFIVFIYTIYYI